MHACPRHYPLLNADWCTCDCPSPAVASVALLHDPCSLTDCRLASCGAEADYGIVLLHHTPSTPQQPLPDPTPQLHIDKSSPLRLRAACNTVLVSNTWGFVSLAWALLRTAHCVGICAPGYIVAGVQKGSDAFRAFICSMRRASAGPTSTVPSAKHTVLQALPENPLLCRHCQSSVSRR